MFKVIPILCLALVAVKAYDFSDTYFNQFLFEEYELLNTNAVSRQRRNADEVSGHEAVEKVLALAALPEESTISDKHQASAEHMETPALDEVHDPVKTLIVVEALAPEKDNTPVHIEHPAAVESSAPVKEGDIHAETTAKTSSPHTTAAPVHVEIPAPVKTHGTTTQAPVAVKPHGPTTQAPEYMDKSTQCGGSMNEMKKDITCCDANKHDPAYFAMIRGTKKECAKKLRTNNPDVENFDPFNCKHMEKIKDLIICESECVAKTLNMLDEHGAIKGDVVIDNFKKRLPNIEESKIKTLESYVDKCLNKIKDLHMKSDKNECSPAPMEFQHCMFGEMVVGCPAEHQINTARCQKIRERYSKGESLALGRHSLYDFLHPAKRNGVHGKE